MNALSLVSRVCRCAVIGCLAGCLFAGNLRADDAAATETEPAPPLDFAADVRPILTAHCIECHGVETREAGLRLDRKGPALAGGDSGQVITPGDAGRSPLVLRIQSADPEERMPPEGDPLTAGQIAVLTRWIDAGANWPDGIDGPVTPPSHWAYQPLRQPEPPPVADARTPIDAFVRQRLAADGILPSPIADRPTLIKRLYYDLIGLPPEPQAVDDFLNDETPDAIERVVDGLLRSPHFGERWGRHWLDLARYADSDGYEKDRPRYNAWKYRDWVIAAVNDDMPFDRFTIEQLAGDLLPEPTDNQLLATAFNRQTLTNTEGGTDQEQWRVEAIFDRVETLGTAWLGLTIGCARCHSHKYDDISQREYYQLFAFFNNGDEASTQIPSSPEALAEYRARKVVHDAKLAELRQPLDAAREAVRPGFDDWAAHERQRLADAAAQGAAFHKLNISQIVSQNGATIEQLPDGSSLVSGALSKQDVYIITAVVDGPLTGFKLEVLADKSLPLEGPGRANNGNFVLSEITVDIAENAASPGDARRVPFVAARADFSQGKYPVAQAIDGVEDSSGWALKGSVGRNHEAVFAFGAPLPTDAGQPSLVTVRLSQQYKSSPHTIGRFRVLGMTGFDADLLPLPESVRTILAVEPDKRSDKQQTELFDYYAARDPEVQRLQATVNKFEKDAPFDPRMAIDVLRERTAERRMTRVMKRGDFLQPLGEVEPHTFEILHAFTSRKDDAAGDRLDLAQWLVSPENPLTSRVVVNHIWAHLFGRGLVKTAGDFGVRGEQPTHPELLDWLASEFIRQGWSRKALIKTIVLSQTYQQSSAHRPELVEVDPENRWLSRQNRFRVEAEIVRDLCLAASGLLDRRIGGPSVFPPLPPGIAELSYANNFKWGDSDWNTRPDRPHGVAPRDDVHRRGMYTFFKRTSAHPNLVTFDCPDANTTCVERRTSNTPLQALTTLNNDIFVTIARAFARRVMQEVDTNDAERLVYAFSLCTARPPTSDELNSLQVLLADARAYYGQHAEEALEFAGDDRPADVSPAEMAAWVTTARILLNLDEFITRE